MNENMQESCVCQNNNQTCTSISTKYADVSLPIKLKPYAIVGNIQTECCSEPIVTFHQRQTLAATCCCEFTITQTICIRVPVEYGTTADVGETTVCCNRNSNCHAY